MALRLVNRDRRLNGLPPLVEDTLLSQAAQLHAQDMLTRNYYAHVTPEGKTPTDRFAQLGGRGGVGENIVQLTGSIGITLNYKLIEQFQKSWMYSQGHRENLLNPEYTRFGYGIVADPSTGRAYAVQNFSPPEP
ncbi:CAP domain-containing protein [Thermosynechococcaceae cyanobacterium Okahandja]